MLASELIERLQTLIDSCGDYKVIGTEYDVRRHDNFTFEFCSVFVTDYNDDKAILLE